MKITSIFAFITLLSFLPQILAKKHRDTIVAEWNKVAVQAVEDAGYGPTAGQRAISIMHTAMYNAWAPYDSKAIGAEPSNIPRQPKSKRTDINKHVAVSYAAYHALKVLFPTQQSVFDEVMRSHGYNIKHLSTKTKAAALIGIQVAEELLKYRENDGSNQLGNLNPSGVPYSEPILLPGYTPYHYVNTVDELNDINYWQPQRNPDGTSQEYLTPHWGIVKPFALSKGSQFRPSEGAITTDDYFAFLAQAQQIYDLSKILTPKQELIGKFWDGVGVDNPNPWNHIAQEISKRDKNSLDDDIKLFFAISNALFDGTIVAYDTKRVYNSVRPVTVIQNLIDPTWQTLIPTPPHPDYVAGHSTTSASVREAFEGVTGSDYYGGSFTHPTTGITLKWKTFTDAMKEAGVSRMYAGIHSEHAVAVGQEIGRKAGKVVWKKVKRLFEGHRRN